MSNYFFFVLLISLVFYVFILLTSIMLYTTNPLIMFLAFDCLLLTIPYYLYKSGCFLNSDSSANFLFLWNLVCALIVLFCLFYVFRLRNC